MNVFFPEAFNVRKADESTLLFIEIKYSVESHDTADTL